MSTRCQRCGTIFPASVRFCPHCGLQNPSVQFVPGNPPPNPQTQENIANPVSFPSVAPTPPFTPTPVNGQGAASVPSVPGTPSLQPPPNMGASHAQFNAGNPAPPHFSAPPNSQGVLRASAPAAQSAANAPAPPHFPASPNSQGMLRVNAPQAPQAGSAPVSPHFPASPNSQGMLRVNAPQSQPVANAPAPSHFPGPAAPHVPAPAGPSVGGAIGRALKPGRVAKIAAYIKHTTAAKLIIAAAVVVIGGGAVFGYNQYQQYRATLPTTFVIGTDRGNSQIVRIDLATRTPTVLLSNKVLPGAPDSAVFINDTQMLINFPNNGEIGIGDIQNNTYKRVATVTGTLRDMALRPDGSGVLISDENGNILEYNVSDHSIKTFVQNIAGVQGLAFGPDGALYAAVGGQVIQLDPGSGKQIKTFSLPGGSDGMAYDPHLNTLDIASGSGIITLDPKTGITKTLIDGIGTTDGVAIDRHGNLFIASYIGILELTVDNQLLFVGTDSNGVTWDDVAPLSGSGAANY